MDTDEPTATNKNSASFLDRPFINDIITRSSQNRTDRRRFLRSAGLAGLGVIGGGAVLGAVGGVASAAPLDDQAPSDPAILNFALNLEYLEANFYSYAVYGHGIASNLMSGTGNQGGVTGGKAVPFKSKAIKQLATEIAGDELTHVTVLRSALSSAAVSQPAINIQQSFTAAAQAAGVIPAGKTFDPYANEDDFLLGAFLFEDVGVTAYKGAAPLITSKAYLQVAAGILAVEAYHAAAIRTRIYDLGLSSTADKIAAARNSLGGPKGVSDGPTVNGVENIVPDNGNNGQVYGRTPGQVLNIVYLNAKTVTSGGFYPNGVNGVLNTSGAGTGTSQSSATTPSGAPQTGGGGTAGTRDKDLLVAGGVALAGAATAGVIAAKHARQPTIAASPAVTDGDENTPS